LRFIVHTISRTPLHREQLVPEAATYTMHNKHRRRTSMPSAGFKHAIPAIKWPQTYALEGTAIGIGRRNH
jgi:hypothetical protein